uniref:Uncharacterized protein n=1 Tax=Lactuca sativa TaxID=4236 RepID=A0A9R1V8P6_LACSA|nr:hypothetical protein LSAT_V11C600321160 [Lactuca sativa]
MSLEDIVKSLATSTQAFQNETKSSKNYEGPDQQVDEEEEIVVEQESEVTKELADCSLVRPKGVLEDVLVQVNELIFQAGFYVLDMGDDGSPNSSSILLGRPFLKTAITK